MSNRTYYVIRECEEHLRILREELNGLGDKDIHNLEYLLYSIKPGSFLFRRGCIKTLRKAIALFRKQNAIEEKRGDDMPSVEHMRSAISDAYPGEGWKYRCEHMHENQVIAIYRSLMKRGVFDSGSKQSCGGTKQCCGKTKQTCEACKDAPRFIPYTGVQLSMFDVLND